MVLTLVVVLLTLPALADEVHEGKVVAVGEKSITIQDKEGENETFAVDEDCKITHDGKPATLKEIDDGDMAKVTVKVVKGKPVAVAIEAKSRK
jgi:hypothetical protein